MSHEALQDKPSVELTETQMQLLIDLREAAALVSGRADEQRVDQWSTDKMQIAVPSRVSNTVFSDLTTNEIAAYMLTIPGGKLKDPFPRYAVLNDQEQEVLERGWRTMTQQPPDKMGLFADMHEGSYVDQNDVLRTDDITVVGWTASYPVDTEGMPNDLFGQDFWGSRQIRIVQRLGYWVAKKDPVAHIARSLLLHGTNPRRFGPTDVVWGEASSYSYITDEVASRQVLDIFTGHIALVERSQIS